MPRRLAVQGACLLENASPRPRQGAKLAPRCAFNIYGVNYVSTLDLVSVVLILDLDDI